MPAIGTGIGIPFQAVHGGNILLLDLALKNQLGKITFARTGNQTAYDHNGLLHTIRDGNAAFCGARIDQNYFIEGAENDFTGWDIAGNCADGGAIDGPFPGTTGRLITGFNGDSGDYIRTSASEFSIITNLEYFYGTIYIKVESSDTIQLTISNSQTGGVRSYTYTGTGDWERTYVAENMDDATNDTLFLILRSNTGLTATEASIYYATMEKADGSGILPAGLFPASLPSGDTFHVTENGNTQTGTDSGIITEAEGSAIAVTTLEGLLIERASTNKCTNYNAVPDSGLTNLTKTGDAAATLTRVTDATELSNAGLDRLAQGDYVVKFDNSAGVGFAFCAVGGQVGNTNAHSMSIWARLDAASTGACTMRLSNGSHGVTISGTSYQRIHSQNFTPDFSTRTMSIYAAAGGICYFVLNQLEEQTVSTGEIITEGATGSRAATTASFPESGNINLNRGWGVFGIKTRWADSANKSNDQIFMGGYIDANNHWFVQCDQSTGVIRFRKRLSAVNTDANLTATFSKGDELVIAFGWSESSGMILDVYNKTTTTNYTAGTNANTAALPSATDGNIYLGNNTGASTADFIIKGLKIYNQEWTTDLLDAAITDLAAKL